MGCNVYHSYVYLYCMYVCMYVCPGVFIKQRFPLHMISTVHRLRHTWVTFWKQEPFGQPGIPAYMHTYIHTYIHTHTYIHE